MARDGGAAARMYAIANALEGDEPGRGGAAGGRPKGHPPRRLTPDEEAALAAVILEGPDPERDGTCAWTRVDRCRWLAAEFGKTCHELAHFCSVIDT